MSGVRTNTVRTIFVLEEHCVKNATMPTNRQQNQQATQTVDNRHPTKVCAHQETAEPVAPHWQSDYRLTALNTNFGACDVQWCTCVMTCTGARACRAVCITCAAHAHVKTRARHTMNVNTYCVSRSCDVVWCNLVFGARKDIAEPHVQTNSLQHAPVSLLSEKTTLSDSLWKFTSTAPSTSTSTASSQIQHLCCS